MLAVIDFIRENLSWILSVAAAIAAIVFAIIKKRPVANFYDHFLVKLFEKIPSWIYAAEVKYQLGVQKKDYVLKQCSDFLETIGFPEDQYSFKQSLIDLCDDYIEKILETPRKKGDLFGCK